MTHWHYPNPEHPSAEPLAVEARGVDCPTCGAPADAQCLTRRGRLAGQNHVIRRRLFDAAPATEAQQ